MSKMTVEVVTPERVVYSGQAEMVIARGVQGDLGILPNHMPLVSPLKIAPVRIKTEGEKEVKMAVSGGFMEVRGDKVTILAETAELPGDIDVERAKAAKARAEKRLAEKYAELDVQRAERALQRAMARLDVTK
ncbi:MULTISPECIES: F0F1 ATP synthase subunit epsilon [Brevibacillus]|jgi:F-type H+-transporting ATPase subunit epsilon|uniref:ATP synthase epsilon chain n=1 Tax=Brevibacillus parabrevis TaxID=54914 RepID=A0A4Y3P9Z4_BREPA|nr:MULTISPECIES: F0F1 ATP synthase subunit epsilon [Brevibacillus]MBU8713602.1 F0F1 ATP synthase subunit epsilon [Brevibacillus parabrevis]MDH6350949.1 F-type H+-transporting ATPase subunit epsilon [Brevibacillus sp. 1238]MDR4997804.1 F0F1 ATP synthase subunit epsilon [Brevibacillus parabrevis]MED2256099.1 F0F1 ATP synthase subunit epsilon [Brevibacillus parabrevis]NRQ53398.1 F0F1 ATP synthase subunit epsilon [Brevibacillus sp. HD1.4A]